MNPVKDVAGVGRVEYFRRIQSRWEKPIWKRSRASNSGSVLALMVGLFVPCVSAWAQYAVNASAGTGGSISPTGTVAAVAGTNLTFTAVAAIDNMVNQWLLDGVTVQTGGVSYVLTDIQTNHDVQVTFTFVPEGTWTFVLGFPLKPVLLMLLLSDGSVMAQGGGSTAWYRLKPDSHGSYRNGVWSTLMPMNDARLYCSSAVLRDGRVYVGGGEYGTGTGKAEVYDPVSDTWTKAPDSGVYFTDSMCKILPDGKVLQACYSGATAHGTIIFDPVANTWLPGPDMLEYHAETSWVKLPDDSILTIDYISTTTERYIPSLNQWIPDATVPFSVYSNVGGEIGPALLLSDGRAFFLGGNGHTAFYTPSGSTNPGTWTQGPDIPNGLVCPDAPGAMMVNGKVRIAASPPLFVDGSGNLQFPSPTTFFDFDPMANAFIQVLGFNNSISINLPPYQSCMLDLPDGTVLYSQENSFLRRPYIYSPPGPPLAAGKPTIIRIISNPDGSFHLIGTLLNGISEGAAYGDDFQMDSNYPLVRLADSSNNVYYARTFNWSSTSVMTSNRPVTTEFSLPTNLPSAIYTLVAVANGISSDPVTVILPSPTQLTGAGVTNGAMQFFLNGLVGNNYLIEVSPDLINWHPFSTNLMPASGSVPITDPIAADQPGQFYRARLIVE